MFTPDLSYIEGGSNGPSIIAVTESNNVYALNAVTEAVIWRRNMGHINCRPNPDTDSHDYS